MCQFCAEVFLIASIQVGDAVVPLTEGLHVCNLVDADGSVCGADFVSRRGLWSHQRRKRRGHHGRVSKAAQACWSNACLLVVQHQFQLHGVMQNSYALFL